MNLLHIVVEASKTSDRPRLNRRAAENVIRAVAEWLDEQGCADAARTVRDHAVEPKPMRRNR